VMWMKIQGLWDVTPCRLVNIYRCFWGAYLLQMQDPNSPKDYFWSPGYLGGQLFRKVSKYLPIDTVSHPTGL
jgi:hypothetical protein